MVSQPGYNLWVLAKLSDDCLADCVFGTRIAAFGGIVCRVLLPLERCRALFCQVWRPTTPRQQEWSRVGCVLLRGCRVPTLLNLRQTWTNLSSTRSEGGPPVLQVNVWVPPEDQRPGWDVVKTCKREALAKS
ncbi:unnamed protein product [Effrenium voratum]|uniref:Uncharacterized protein n=1 Tax=Effrenium voratum TaxID=2562239 RepID=A0AA36J3K1_9DINO|nr:unnamed protein product [Effrenium voratum]